MQEHSDNPKATPVANTGFKPRSISPRELPIPTCILEFYLGVTRCPDGNAYGCMDLRNRGLELMYEVTCWPKQKHGKFTTGESQGYTFLPDPVILNDEEKRICKILGLSELELGTFLKCWEPATRPKTVLGYQALLKYGDQTKEWICKDCGHVWLACNRIVRCPHCNSAWWWTEATLGDLSEAEKMTISQMYGEEAGAE